MSFTKRSEKIAKAATDETTEARSPSLRQQMLKTKFCMYHLQGVCHYGDKCLFAHSIEELQGGPDMSKQESGPRSDASSDGDSQPVRNEEQCRSPVACYKSALCMWHARGHCRNGERCTFAHGSEELRTRGSQEPQEGTISSGPDRDGNGRDVQRRTVRNTNNFGSPRVVSERGIAPQSRLAPGLSLPNVGPKRARNMDEPMFVQTVSPMSATTTAPSSPEVRSPAIPMSSPPGLAVPPEFVAYQHEQVSSAVTGGTGSLADGLVGLKLPVCDGSDIQPDMDMKSLSLNIDAISMHLRFLEMQMYSKQQPEWEETEMPGAACRRLDLFTLLGA